MDTTASDLKLFIIPKGIEFELQTDLKRVKYDNLVFENVRGGVEIRNQAVHLNGLSMRGMDADMAATVVYRATERKMGYAGFDFRLRKINIGKLVDFIPSLDSVVPMLRSFKGLVNFEAAAESRIDSNLNIKIPQLACGSTHRRGQSGADGRRNLCRDFEDADVQKQEAERIR